VCLIKMNKLGLLMFATVFSPALGLASDFSSYKNALQILVEPEPRPSVGLVASGFGASGNSFFAAASYTDRDEQTDGNDDDGSIIVGAGFGDPIDAVGVEVSLGLTSVSTSLWGDGKFADHWLGWYTRQPCQYLPCRIGNFISWWPWAIRRYV